MDFEGGATKPLLKKDDTPKKKKAPSNNDNDSEKEKLEPINYAFLNGLRGIGAFSVYLFHRYSFFPQGGPYYTPPMTDPTWVTNIKATPFCVFFHGYFWVLVFFILSGFVLPLRWFKTRKPECIFSGCLRRYFRLMIPYWVIISIYYFVAHAGFTHRKILPGVKAKNYG